MGMTKKLYDAMVLEVSDDFDYQYEQWLEERMKEQREAELAAYEELLSDMATFITIK